MFPTQQVTELSVKVAVLAIVLTLLWVSANLNLSNGQEVAITMTTSPTPTTSSTFITSTTTTIVVTSGPEVAASAAAVETENPLLSKRLNHESVWEMVASMDDSNSNSNSQSSSSGSNFNGRPSFSTSTTQQPSPSTPIKVGGPTKHPSPCNNRHQTNENWPSLEHKIELDLKKGYALSWTSDYNANEITLALSINLTSSNFKLGSDIFALGFSHDGRQQSSDYCLIWFDLAHKLHLQDARVDASNRLELVEQSRSVCQLLDSNVDKLHKLMTAMKPQTAISGKPQPLPVRAPSPPPIKKIKTVSEDSILITDGEDYEDPASMVAQTEKPVPSYQDQHHQHHHHHHSNEQHVYMHHRSLINNDNNKANKHHRPKDSKLLAGCNGNPIDPMLFEIFFTRPLDVCESLAGGRYYAIDNGTTNLVWFALKGPVITFDGLNLTRMFASDMGDPPMAYSGTRMLQMVATKVHEEPITSSQSPSPHELSSLEMSMSNYEIPAKETTYWCKLFKLPRKFEPKRFHITRYEPVIDEANAHVVHHMELFNCADLSSNQRIELDKLYQTGGWQGECSSSSRPVATEPCKRVIMAWAMGAKPFVYPSQVGQPIGGPGYSPYALLEVHYNNVHSTAGLVDGSGLRFSYTSKLRSYDAGILEVGLEYTDKNSIPPNLVAPLAGYCVSDCTRVAMTSSEQADIQQQQQASCPPSNGSHGHPKRTSGAHRSSQRPKRNSSTSNDNSSSSASFPGAGIFVFAGQMHTHLTGVQTWTEHVRAGRLVGELQRDNHYSPHFQEIRLLPRVVNVRPGDALIHYCVYDTRTRPNITLGGFGTTDEMCVTYLHYYPRIDLEVCKSSIDSRALQAYFRHLALEEKQPTSTRLLELASSSDSRAGLDIDAGHGQAKSVADNYRSVEWSPKRSLQLLQLYANSPISVQCNRSNGNRYPGDWTGMAKTQLWSDLQADEPFELRRMSGRELASYRGPNHDARHAQCSDMLAPAS